MSNADELGARHYWSEEDNARLAVSYNVTIVAVVMRHAKRMCLVILQYVAANLAAPYFSTLSQKKKLFEAKRVFIFSTTSVRNISNSKDSARC
jgi:hypothetical protein